MIPGLDFSDNKGEDGPALQTKKVPYAKPVPKQFEKAWETGVQPPTLVQGLNHIFSLVKVLWRTYFSF